MFKVNNKDTITLVSLLLVLNMFFTPCSNISIGYFEHVTADWKVFRLIILARFRWFQAV